MSTETLLRRIYTGQKYPHVYMLSISIAKNQSTEEHGGLYIPTFEYNYIVITRCDKDYKNITSSIGANVRIQGNVQVWTVQGVLMSYNRKTLEPSRGPRRMGLQTVCWRSTLPLRISDQQPEESTSSKLLDLNMQVQGSQNSPTNGVMNARWCA